MSPQLGQGANMALFRCMGFGTSGSKRKKKMKPLIMFNSGKRIINTVKSSTAFYQFLSRLLTPLYQSDLWWAGGLRDFSFALDVSNSLFP